MAKRVCPFWVGYLLINPLRKLFENPDKLLKPHITSGMTVLDVGSGMGFFSLPIARMVGAEGKVVCVDVQEKMLKSLEKRARKAGLSERIETRICRQSSLGLDDLNEAVDFALAFAVVHEVPNTTLLFDEIFNTLKPTGKLLIAEPKGHVSEKDFNRTISVAQQNRFKIIDNLLIPRNHTVLLKKEVPLKN